MRPIVRASWGESGRSRRFSEDPRGDRVRIVFHRATDHLSVLIDAGGLGQGKTFSTSWIGAGLSLNSPE
jgi:hypothetical protein